MNIAAIPTQYNGYRCRSRLEARWIVFLEAMRIDFQYEPEGYQLSDGTCYLPDFFFPHVRMFAEVKPFEFFPDEKDKCKLLVDGTGFPVLLLEGPPDFRTYNAVFSADLEGMTDLPGTRYETDFLLDVDWHGRKFYDQQKRFYSCTEGQWRSQFDFSEHYRYCVTKARSASFDGRAA